MKATALVGGQFGSEGKGLIAGHIARDHGHHVRVGAANAGHTVYTMTGTPKIVDGHDVNTHIWSKHVLQQIPCAAYANPDAKLWIGPGALISTDILEHELDAVNQWRHERGMKPVVLNVDKRAQIIQRSHIEQEFQSGLANRIGSTSATAREGIGMAQAMRVMRDASCLEAHEYRWERNAPHVQVRDVPAALWSVVRGSRGVLLEGTQGAGLSLPTGFFPYVTSRCTTAAGLAADCGLGPNDVERIVLCARTFPIRVAGNSGPFYPDSTEIEWEFIGVDPQSERTTVTKKIRRVATFSLTQLWEAARLNSATEVALTFCDYVQPELRGRTDVRDDELNSGLAQLILDIETEVGLPVTYLGTGPHSIVERYHRDDWPGPARWRSETARTAEEFIERNLDEFEFNRPRGKDTHE